MEIIALILLVIGGIIALIGSIWMLVEQFKTGILWLLACIFIPFAALVWLAMHWEEGKMPFLVSLAGGALVVVGIFMSGEKIV